MASRRKRLGIPKGYPGVYPPPPHIPVEKKAEAIRYLLDKKHRAKLSFRKNLFFRLGARLVNYAVRLIFFTCKETDLQIDKETQALIDDPTKQFIVAMWHNRLFYSVYTLKARVAEKCHDILAIISDSDDGEFIARATEQWGAFVSRGSATRGGIKALKKILRFVKLHFHPLITPDGPQGPVYEIKEGLPALAKITGLPVVCVCYDAKRKWVFNSWDKFIAPKPFSKIALRYSAPIHVDKEMSIAKATAILSETMMGQVNELAETVKNL